ncbi:Capsule biosynthesis protein CapB [Corynebacterium urogenitale]|uniref:Capsule biosynthesis protein CapB n=1 Tax=Corynebacterium urogenitale TaxID=2487892 RepID=A0A5J6ZC53_9CORY|nr:poly-gamma-glutamate synthase PgsB [Corynebacterium urogenitale]QFQ03313.1 Capsule biosynthesis protein CapB [Corynebacterium urogenitale]
MFLFFFLSLVFVIGFGTLFWRSEKAHNERLNRLDVNIHVNGIRGKSTVTRMLGGVVRAAGIPTIAKTTGTYACVISPDAEEHPIKRTGPANIGEQYDFLRKWIGPEVRGLVTECMAVKPRYQEICQCDILKSPITVITNVRLDHQEEMGDTLEEIARSLCTTIPEGGIVVTGERDPELREVIQEEADLKGAEVVFADPSELSHSLVKKFNYHQFEENVAVALAVAEIIGIDPQTACEGMLSAKPDPGTITVTEVSLSDGKDLFWVPMFAINDWESTVKVFQSVAEESLPQGAARVVALNNREDRTDRAKMFLDLISSELRDEIDRIVLYGELQDAVYQMLLDEGFSEEHVVQTNDFEEDCSGRELINRAVEDLDHDEVALFGMVNIHTEQVTKMRHYIDALVEGQESKVAV